MSTTSPTAEVASRIGRRDRGRGIDKIYIALVAAASLLALVAIGFFVAVTASRTGKVWDTFGVWGFVTGTKWVPSPAQGLPVFGALPAIYGTVLTSAIALLIAAPVAIGIALATTVFLPQRLRKPVASLVDLLAAVPSVVYGVWGLLVLVPATKPLLSWLAEHTQGIPLLGGPIIGGQSFILAGIVLAVMIIPIIAAISREVLQSVPNDQREAALALGATRWEMVRGAMLPWSRSGIVGACALGLGRAVGETIAIAFVLGNYPEYLGKSIFSPGTTLASQIAGEVNDNTGDLHLQSLIALGVLMFLIAFGINALARLIVARSARGPRRPSLRFGGQKGGATARPETNVSLPEMFSRIDLPETLSPSRRRRSRGAETTIYGFLGLAMIPLVLIIGSILLKGVPALSWDFFTQDPPSDPNAFSGGIRNAIVGSLMMMIIATAIAAPLGILVALFIHETTAAPKPVRTAARGVGFVVDVLLGAPSIVIGLLVYVALVLGHQYSAFAGSIALAVIMFPIVVRSTDEILRLVPRSLSEASLALGARRWKTAWSVVLPAAAPGIITGVMLALARAAGETAPLLFTSLGNQQFSLDVNAPIEALPHQIFQDIILTVTPATEQRAWGAALVLISIILGLTLIARLLGRRSQIAR